MSSGHTCSLGRHRGVYYLSSCVDVVDGRQNDFNLTSSGTTNVLPTFRSKCRTFVHTDDFSLPLLTRFYLNRDLHSVSTGNVFGLGVLDLSSNSRELLEENR